MAENPSPGVPAPSGNPPQRGALLVTMKPDSPTITAGANFSISVTINNPFDVAVSIENITTLLPVDLYDVKQMAQERQKAKAHREAEEKAGQTQKGLSQFVKNLFPNFGLINYGPTASNLATAVETTQTQSDELTDKTIRFKSVEIQPGDSITNVFVLQTRRGLWFTPNTYNLDVSIKYKIGPILHNQSVPYTLDIQAGLRYIVVGAVIGSLFGILAKEIDLLAQGKFVAFLTTAVSTIIISGFAVIAFARKTGVQPLLTIQDFWGGLLIGFLVGYSGTQVFGNLFSGAGTTAATATPIPALTPTP
jgi:hypothetical protein